MLVIGAGGFAKQLFDEVKGENSLCFFDDVNSSPEKLWNQYSILRSSDNAAAYLRSVDNRFVLGIGNPLFRRQLAQKFRQLGGELTRVISANSFVSCHAVLEEGVSVLKGAIVEPDAHISEGCLVNVNVVVTHDVFVGSYTEIAPGAMLLGKCYVGANCQIGAGAIVLPKVRVGDGAIIGAGSVVTKDVKENTCIAGVPAKEIAR
jgi:sugar O-acyltransferase (sialic acid O-acetyltransferase NeuD family)